MGAWKEMFTVWQDQFATPRERRLEFELQLECFAHWVAMRSKDWELDFRQWVEAMETDYGDLEYGPEQLSLDLETKH